MLNKLNPRQSLNYALIVTNINEWFIFDAQEFEKAFIENKQLVKYFIDFENGVLGGNKTDLFYKDIIIN